MTDDGTPQLIKILQSRTRRSNDRCTSQHLNSLGQIPPRSQTARISGCGFRRTLLSTYVTINPALGSHVVECLRTRYSFNERRVSRYGYLVSHLKTRAMSSGSKTRRYVRPIMVSFTSGPYFCSFRLFAWCSLKGLYAPVVGAENK